MEGKRVLIIFEDGQGASKRQGVVTREDEFFVEINYHDLIPRARIIRIEVLR